MFRDYKNRIPAYRDPKPSHFRRRRQWFSLGVLGVLFLAGSTYWFSARNNSAVETKTIPLSTPSPAVMAPSANLQHKESVPAGVPKKIEPRFTFYKILSEKEVIIPENEVKTIRREELASKLTPVGHYFIQVGSFINQTDAEKLKAQMLQIKIPAKLEMIQVDNSTWFRVKVGPYSTLNDVEKVRHYLKTHRVDSVVQKSNR